MPSVKPEILLSSVYGPYAVDDNDGSRRINPMELYHNQVTREQGVFSLRMFHRSWGLMMIQANIRAPTTLLDFPSLDRFITELRAVPYDVVGLSAIMPNLEKLRRMCLLVRKHNPKAQIVVGGHVTGVRDLKKRVDADHIVRGEGISWFRDFLGEDKAAPVRHPVIPSASWARTMGIQLSVSPRDTAGVLIPSVGCPMGCDFCSTSAMFGGKGRYINFYETGDELFRVMRGLEREAGFKSFFVMDENFLLHRKRALRLLELMKEHKKAWSLYLFSSANALKAYSMDELVGLGVSWVWLGLEGDEASYVKLQGSDTFRLVKRLQGAGIRVLGSTIIGLPEHRPENVRSAIRHAIRHGTEFHQFMLFTAVPGTPLHEDYRNRGLLTREEELAPADTHGQLRFNFRHPHIPPGHETDYLKEAFRRDFRLNGPSVLRVAKTLLRGWQTLKKHPEARVRRRLAQEIKALRFELSGALWAAERWFRREHPRQARRIALIRKRLHKALGLRARLAGWILGRFIALRLKREAKSLDQGRVFEPPTFCERAQISVDPGPRAPA